MNDGFGRSSWAEPEYEIGRVVQVSDPWNVQLHKFIENPNNAFLVVFLWCCILLAAVCLTAGLWTLSEKKSEALRDRMNERGNQ